MTGWLAHGGSWAGKYVSPCLSPILKVPIHGGVLNVHVGGIAYEVGARVDVLLEYDNPLVTTPNRALRQICYDEYATLSAKLPEILIAGGVSVGQIIPRYVNACEQLHGLDGQSDRDVQKLKIGTRNHDLQTAGSLLAVGISTCV